MAAQSYGNHGRVDPKFHFFLMPLCLICLVSAILHVRHHPTAADILLVPVTLAIFCGFFMARVYALHNQDRLIRLEEHLRMQRLGVAPDGLSTQQVIALRFASDEELPRLAARARSEMLEPKAIKQTVQTWRADTFRI